MKITHKISLLIGIVSFGGGAVSTLHSSRVVTEIAEKSLHDQARTGARMIREEPVSQLAVLQELANKETVRTMNWTV